MKMILALILTLTALMIGGCSSDIHRGQIYVETVHTPGFHGRLTDTGYERRLRACLSLRREQNARQGYNPMADDVASCEQYANGGGPLHSTIPDDLRMSGIGGYGLGGMGIGGGMQIQGAYVPLNAPTVAPAPIAPAPVTAPVPVPVVNAPVQNGGYVTQGQYQAEQRVILQRIESQRR